jgi:hypothetical protein
LLNPLGTPAPASSEFLLRNVHWLSSSCERANFISTKEEARWQNDSQKGPFFVTTFSLPFKDESGTWRNGTSFGLHDLEALMNVAFEAKVDRRSCPEALNRFNGKPSGIRRLHFLGMCSVSHSTSWIRGICAKSACHAHTPLLDNF